MGDTAIRIAAILRKTPVAVDVRVEQTEGLPMLDIRPDRDALSRFGITAQAVQDTVSAAIGGREAGVIFEGDRRFAVTIRLADDSRADFQSLGQLPVPLPGSGFVPLQSVADIGVTDGPNQIGRENGKRRIIVEANVRGRDVAGVVADARTAIDAQVRLHSGEYLDWGGQFENLRSASERLMLVVPGCFVLILLLLYGALGSVRDAAIVFTGVPFALGGGVRALLVRGSPFWCAGAVGCIALSGIEGVNGRVMTTSIQRLVAQGADRAQAARDGAMMRLRPVVVTALVASLGFLPMAIATGPGAEVQRPLATVVIGGLVSATLLTLFLLPTLYARHGRRTTAPALEAEGKSR